MFRTLTVVITYIAILPKSTECADPSLLGSNPSPTVVLNNSLFSLPDINASLIDPISGNSIRPYCTSQISWLGFDLPVPQIFIDNCKTADEMLRSDLAHYSSQKFDFLSRAYTPLPGFQVIRTPRKYTAGTIWACTITLVNLNVVPQVYLQPPHLISRFPVSDVASYYDIRDVLANIWVSCLYGPPETQVGYWVTGQHRSLGVFVYGSKASIAFGMPNSLDSEEYAGTSTRRGQRID